MSGFQSWEGVLGHHGVGKEESADRVECRGGVGWEWEGGALRKAANQVSFRVLLRGHGMNKQTGLAASLIEDTTRFLPVERVPIIYGRKVLKINPFVIPRNSNIRYPKRNKPQHQTFIQRWEKIRTLQK